MDLLSVGTGEILMILLVAILVIGPNKIVKFARQLGQLSRNLKRMTSIKGIEIAGITTVSGAMEILF